jgi:hypothetical protein
MERSTSFAVPAGRLPALQARTWRQFAETLQDAVGMGHVLECKELEQCGIAAVTLDVGDLQEPLEFTGKAESALFESVVERFFAHAIAGKHEMIQACVPDGERKHATQMPHKVQTVLFVEVHDDLGVPFCAELVTGRKKLPAEFAVIVNLAIKHDLNGLIFVAQWLSTAPHVDDA